MEEDGCHDDIQPKEMRQEFFLFHIADTRRDTNEMTRSKTARQTSRNLTHFLRTIQTFLTRDLSCQNLQMTPALSFSRASGPVTESFSG